MLSRLIFLIVIFSLGIQFCNPKDSHTNSSDPALPYGDELQAALHKILDHHSVENRLGISAAIFLPGYTIWTGVAGVSYPGIPIATNMLFDAGSIEKNFQAALVLKLVESGDLLLDDPISQYLPDFRNVNGNATIRQLLNHTSGIFNVFEHPDFPWLGDSVDYSKQWELEDVINEFVMQPYGPPGYVQHYSSTNYLLLTNIIEKVTGSSVPTEIERRFLKPCSLEHTFVSNGKPPPGHYPVAHPWVDVDDDGDLDDLYGIPLVWKSTLTHPVMFSTPKDLVRWMNALFSKRSIIKASSLHEMITFPEVAIMDPGGNKYGLGVVDYSDILGVSAIGHGGSSLGYSAAALFLPEQNISIAWMINTGENPVELANQLMSDTWRSLYTVIEGHKDQLH